MNDLTIEPSSYNQRHEEQSRLAARRLLGDERVRREQLDNQYGPAYAEYPPDHYPDREKGEVRVEIGSGDERKRWAATFVVLERGIGNTRLTQFLSDLPVHCPWCVEETVAFGPIEDLKTTLSRRATCTSCGSSWTEEYRWTSARDFQLGEKAPFPRG